jgi:type IV pilus assembly protein PilW
MHLTRPVSLRAAPAQRGLSLVELLVGVALGLFLVAGASTLFVSHLNNGRRLLLEARLNQDLRATADVITRDLRRAGYWGNALQGTVATGAGSTTVVNPYRTVTPNVGASTIAYNFSRDVAENNALDTNEQFGFDLTNGVIRMTINGVAQAISDPDTLTITAFTIAPTETAVDIRDSCAKTCTGGGCPTITVRQYLLTLNGRATRDPAVTRTLQTRVRVRNDLFSGTCPA